MNIDAMLFFDAQGHTEALPLYAALEKKITEQLPETEIRVQKSQISFYHKHLFACVSYVRVRKKKDCPPVFLVLTLGLPRRLEAPRIEIATEPYPNRWTHHLLLSSEEEIDGELMGWIREAADFAAAK